MKLTYKYSPFVVSVFILLAIGVVTLTAMSVISNARLFEKRYVFTAKFSDAVGLKSTTPVFLKGLKIGNIKDFYLTHDNYILAKLEIFEQYREKITDHSLLHKNVNFITSSTFIQLLPGQTLEQLPEGELVPSVDVPEGVAMRRQYEYDMSGDPIASTLFSLQNFLDNMSYVKGGEEDTTSSEESGEFSNLMGTLFEIADNVKNLTSDLQLSLAVIREGFDEKGESIFTTLNNVAILSERMKTLTYVLESNLKNADTLMAAYSQPEGLVIKMVDPTEQNLLSPMKQSLETINQILPEIQNLAQYSSDQTTNVTVLMEEMKSIMAKLQITIDGLNKSFFVDEEYLEKTKPELSGKYLRLDDYEK